MKALIILMFGLVMTLSQVCAQTNSDVPTKVKSVFSQKFPDAKNVKWGKESDTEWEVEFKLNGKDYSANFITNGTWKETEYGIEKSTIPANINQILNSDFKGYNIEEAEISETKDGKVYEFILGKDESVLEIAISAEGEIVKKVAKEEEEKDKK